MGDPLHLKMLGTRFDIRCGTEGWSALTRLLWEPFVVVPNGNGEVVTIDEHNGSWKVSCGWHADLIQVDPWLLSNEIRHLLVEKALRRSDAIGIHAAAVARARRSIILVGESGAGKTTLTLHLASIGWDYVTDDLVVLDAQGQLMPFPKPLGIKEPARWSQFAHHYANLDWPSVPKDLFLVPPEALGWIDPAVSHEVAAVVFLQRGSNGEVSIEQLSAGRALADLGPYTRPIDASSISVLGAICSQARCAQLISDDPAAAAVRLEELVR